MAPDFASDPQAALAPRKEVADYGSRLWRWQRTAHKGVELLLRRVSWDRQREGNVDPHAAKLFQGLPDRTPGGLTFLFHWNTGWIFLPASQDGEKASLDVTKRGAAAT